jgi:hypothetical protein
MLPAEPSKHRIRLLSSGLTRHPPSQREHPQAVENCGQPPGLWGSKDCGAPTYSHPHRLGLFLAASI